MVSPQNVVLILAISTARAVTVVGNKEVISLVSFVVVTVGVGAAGEVGVKAPLNGARKQLARLFILMELVFYSLGELKSKSVPCLLALRNGEVRTSSSSQKSWCA